MALLALLALPVMAAPAGAATVTIGSPLTQSFTQTTLNGVGTGINVALPEPGAIVASPFDGTVVRWRISGASGGPFVLRVLRPAGGPETFTGAGTSAPATPSSSGVQVFPAALPIKAGDVIGFSNSNKTGDKIGVVKELPGALALSWVPPLADGSTLQATNDSAGIEIAINADVQPPPTLSSIAPSAGSLKGGTRVTIAGSDFSGATGVSFGSKPAASFSVDSDSQITATAPAAKKPLAVNVIVTTPAGSTAAADALFTYRACRVPDVVGKTLRKAKKRLRRARCRPGTVKVSKGVDRATGRVVRQRPRPGKIRAPGAKVKLTLG